MVLHAYLVVMFLAGFSTAVADPDINIICSKDSVRITWMIPKEVIPYAARLLLGNCFPSNLNVTSTGEGEVQYNYPFSECRFKKKVKGKHLIYQNELAFRPKKPNPAAYVFPVHCVTRRPEGWIPNFLNPGVGVSEGRGFLVFNMALLNEQQTGVAQTNVVFLGSFMSIRAAVDQKFHQPLLLLMEECVAASTAELNADALRYPIISNKGCLQESVHRNAMFLPRHHSSELILYLQSFKLSDGDVMYIHCKLTASDPEALDESKRACHYLKESGSWELLDDSSQSALCCSCDSTCKTRKRREVENESRSLNYNSVIGPLFIVDRSDSRTKNMWDTSVPAADSQVQ